MAAMVKQYPEAMSEMIAYQLLFVNVSEQDDGMYGGCTTFTIGHTLVQQKVGSGHDWTSICIPVFLPGGQRSPPLIARDSTSYSSATVASEDKGCLLGWQRLSSPAVRTCTCNSTSHSSDYCAVRPPRTKDVWQTPIGRGGGGGGGGLLNQQAQVAREYLLMV